MEGSQAGPARFGLPSGDHDGRRDRLSAAPDLARLHRLPLLRRPRRGAGGRGAAGGGAAGRAGRRVRRRGGHAGAARRGVRPAGRARGGGRRAGARGRRGCWWWRSRRFTARPRGIRCWPRCSRRCAARTRTRRSSSPISTRAASTSWTRAPRDTLAAYPEADVFLRYEAEEVLPRLVRRAPRAGAAGGAVHAGRRRARAPRRAPPARLGSRRSAALLRLPRGRRARPGPAPLGLPHRRQEPAGAHQPRLPLPLHPLLLQPDVPARGRPRRAQDAAALLARIPRPPLRRSRRSAARGGSTSSTSW